MRTARSRPAPSIRTWKIASVTQRAVREGRLGGKNLQDECKRQLNGNVQSSGVSFEPWRFVEFLHYDRYDYCKNGGGWEERSAAPNNIVLHHNFPASLGEYCSILYCLIVRAPQPPIDHFLRIERNKKVYRIILLKLLWRAEFQRRPQTRFNSKFEVVLCSGNKV